MAKRKGDPLIDQYFHSFDANDEIQWQGQVLHLIKPGIYLCQMYDWLVGMPSSQELITAEQMVAGKFRFYFDVDYWRNQANIPMRRIKCDDEEPDERKPSN